MVDKIISSKQERQSRLYSLSHRAKKGTAWSSRDSSFRQQRGSGTKTPLEAVSAILTSTGGEIRCLPFSKASGLPEGTEAPYRGSPPGEPGYPTPTDVVQRLSCLYRGKSGNLRIFILQASKHAPHRNGTKCWPDSSL